MYTTTPYYHGTIRRYIATFGAVFGKMLIDRVDKYGNIVQTIKVPISYGGKNKWLVQLEQDPNVGNTEDLPQSSGDNPNQLPVAQILPRIAYELKGLSRDSSRQLPQINKNVKKNIDAPGHLLTNYVPTPYNFAFSMTILTKTIADGLRIVEPILSQFNPEVVVAIDDISEGMDLSRDIPITLKDFEMEILYTGDFKKPRVCTWDMNFNLKGHLYSQIKSKAIITASEINMLAGELPLDFELPTELLGVAVDITSPSEPDNPDPIFVVTYEDVVKDIG